MNDAVTRTDKSGNQPENIKKDPKEAKKERLAAALRQNLLRRKAAASGKQEP